MKALIILSCGCGKSDCDQMNPTILCLLSESQEDIQILTNCIFDSEYELQTLALTHTLASAFWNDIQTEERIFRSGKDLLESLHRH